MLVGFGGKFGLVAAVLGKFKLRCGDGEGGIIVFSLLSVLLPSLMRIQAVEFSPQVSSSFTLLQLIITNNLFFRLLVQLYHPRARLGLLCGGFAPRGGWQEGVQSLLAAGVEHPYLGCTLVGASLLVAMCKATRHHRQAGGS